MIGGLTNLFKKKYKNVKEWTKKSKKETTPEKQAVLPMEFDCFWSKLVERPVLINFHFFFLVFSFGKGFIPIAILAKVLFSKNSKIF